MQTHRVPSPLHLVVRCFAQELEGGQWQAFSLELGLAAQGESCRAVRSKLESMIQTYLYDALVGEDREHAVTLLRRRASPSIFLRYYFGLALAKLQGGRPVSIKLGLALARLQGARIKPFNEPLSLEPKHCSV
jgi:hypothetical protein